MGCVNIWHVSIEQVNHEWVHYLASEWLKHNNQKFSTKLTKFLFHILNGNVAIGENLKENRVTI